MNLAFSMLEWPKLASGDGKLLLFCPIETKAREMDAKTLLACVAAERGHKAIIGDMVELRSIVEFLPKGVYLSKSIPDKMEKYFRKYQSLGYDVAAWCEEGLVFLSREVYKRKMVSVGALAHTDLFFAWGDNQARAVTEKTPDSASKVRKVGNPRVDLLRAPYREIYREEANRLRAKYGDYLLFNTNFAAVNNIIGTEHAFMDSKKRGKIVTPEDEEHYWIFHRHRQTIFEKMIELVRFVSDSYPTRRIVVRPHPSENHDTWRRVAEDLDNVDVAFEGSVIPWLMGASAVIHNGCTTAVEAFLLETPAIAYRPVIEEGYEFELPNTVSVQARDPEEVREAINFVSKNDEAYRSWRARAKGHLQEFIDDVDGPLSSDRIVNELEQFYAPDANRREARLEPTVRLVKHRVREILRSVKYAGKTGATRTNHDLDKQRRQKLPDISVGEIEALVARLRRESGRFDGITVNAVAGTRRCFMVAQRD